MRNEPVGAIIVVPLLSDVVARNARVPANHHKRIIRAVLMSDVWTMRQNLSEVKVLLHVSKLHQIVMWQLRQMHSSNTVVVKVQL